MEIDVRLNRRTLLVRASRVLSVALAGWLPFHVGCSRSETSCYDPELFSTPERAQRDAQGYVDISPHSDARQCSGCTFFQSDESEGCGRCQILGGPVRARGHCDAWAGRSSG
jgi:hypothetical protein